MSILYGEFAANDNAGEGQHINPLGPTALERPRYRLDRSSGGIDIVDDDNRASAEAARQVRMGDKGTLHIPVARIARKPDLLARQPVPAHEMRVDGKPGQPRKLLRQQQGLVISAEAQPLAMERDRHEDRMIGQKRVPCPRHQTRTEPGQFRPVAIFEMAHQRAGQGAIGDGRPGPVKGWRIGNRLRRKSAFAQIGIKGQAQDRTERIGNWLQLGKAGAAEHVAVQKRGTAAGANRRVELVEDKIAQAAQPLGQPPCLRPIFDFPIAPRHKTHNGTPCSRGQPLLREHAELSQQPRLFDPALIARHLARRRDTANFVMDLVLEDLADRLGAHMRQFSNAVLIGPDAQSLPDTMMTGSAPVRFARVNALSGTEEFPELPEGEFDLIVSLLHLQAVDDVPGHLARLRARMKPDGLFMAAMIGGESLTELREAFLAADLALSGGASARIAPMVQVRDGGALLQRAGFALPVADVESHKVRYANPFALMAELKALGAANPLVDRPRRPATRSLLTAAAQAYAERDSDPDGRVRATLEIIWLAGWVPHESQQKPLRPGSASVSMKDILEKP